MVSHLGHDRHGPIIAQRFGHAEHQLSNAERIRLIVDNLNTLTPVALYSVFSPEEARRITRKLEFHYTPKHGSWLNMAEY
ncbi:MAG: transposase [Gammaproteobacteria bacterium]|nr:transposase [Gammaproteobacteria bacterium]